MEPYHHVLIEMSPASKNEDFSVATRYSYNYTAIEYILFERVEAILVLLIEGLTLTQLPTTRPIPRPPHDKLVLRSIDLL